MGEEKRRAEEKRRISEDKSLVTMKFRDSLKDEHKKKTEK